MPSAAVPIPVAIVGGSGYVAGELLRLLALHPSFEVQAVLSTSQPQGVVGDVFGHLRGTKVAAKQLEPVEALSALLQPGAHVGLFVATPHGSAAALIDSVLIEAERRDCQLQVVDLSADFRFADPGEFETIYGVKHGAPERCAEFLCAVPEHVEGPPSRHAAQPGCFTTAVVLPVMPLLTRGWVEGPIFVSAVTGSSGSGRSPNVNTHHPRRRSALYAYAALQHRHEREMQNLLAVAGGGEPPTMEFVPHSGPFVRGIHATIRLHLRRAMETDEAVAAIEDTYAGSAFVEASEVAPTLNDVVGTNRCRIGVASRGQTVVLTSVIDNLVKGAAGGAVQWMNRIFGLRDDLGLVLPGMGWF